MSDRLGRPHGLASHLDVVSADDAAGLAGVGWVARRRSLILRGLSKAPEDRPESAGHFRRELLACGVPAWTERDTRASGGGFGGNTRARGPAVERSLALERTISIAPDRY